ncbi:MAG: M23 family metallopeptidase [Candidatus Omnitrophota bacterium]|nr:M23 family metallopeptidase [Candidatus Omnitrophota bacterium]
MKKVVLVIFCLFLILCGFYFLKDRLFWIDKFEFLSPIDYSGDIPIRRDYYGEGNFGAKRSRGRRLHLGIDILAEIGSPVKAAKSGIVLNATRNHGMGKYVEIKHRSGLITIYGHLSKILVKKGQRVKQAETVGEVGKTGNARNRLILPHLHFEVRKFGLPQDPVNYLYLSSNKDRFKLLNALFPNGKNNTHNSQ